MTNTRQKTQSEHAPAEERERDVAILRALGDETRLRLLSVLAQEEMSVRELQKILQLGQSTVSGHLSTLRGAGLVSSRRVGRHTRYALAQTTGPGAVGQQVSSWLATLAPRLSLDPLDQAAVQRALVDRRSADARELERLSAVIGKGSQPGRTWEGLCRSSLLLVPPMDVLDVGIGTGELSLLLARGAHSFTALDINPSALREVEKRARSLGIGIECLCQDAHDPKLGQRTFDLVLFSQSLQYLERPEQAIRACSGSLRPGGRLMLLDLLAHNETWVGQRLGHQQLGFTPEQFRSFAEDTGLRVLELEIVHRESRPPHFQSLVLLAERPAD